MAKIDTPRGSVRTIKTKDGVIKARLSWNKDFRPQKQKQFDNAQQFVDSECLRLCDKYTPKRTGFLIKSGILGTHIGSGEIHYLAPYSKSVYYNKKNYNFQDAPIRQDHWFEFMKKRHLAGIKRGVERKFGKQF